MEEQKPSFGASRITPSISEQTIAPVDAIVEFTDEDVIGLHQETTIHITHADQGATVATVVNTAPVLEPQFQAPPLPLQLMEHVHTGNVSVEQTSPPKIHVEEVQFVQEPEQPVHAPTEHVAPAPLVEIEEPVKVEDVPPTVNFAKAAGVEEEITFSEVDPAEVIAREPSSKVVDYTSPLLVRELNENDSTQPIELPAAPANVLEVAIKNHMSEPFLKSEQGRAAMSGLQAAAGYEISVLNNETTTDPTREFHQRPSINNTTLGPGISNPRGQDTSNLTGSDGIAIIKAKMGLGVDVMWPAWASGFWYSLRSPSADRLRRMFHAISNRKYELGTDIYGLTQLNDRVYVDREIVYMWIEQMTSATLQETNDILNKLKITDIDSIAAALAASIYPQGFPYSRQVITGATEDEMNPVKTVSGIISIPKLLSVDWNSLTQAQRRHMSERHSRRTDEEIRKYQNGFDNRPQVKEIEVSVKESPTMKSVTTFVLEVPNVAKYFRLGDRWISDIIIEADKVLGLDPDADVRRSYLDDKIATTELCRLAHWVKSVRVVNYDKNNSSEDVIEMSDEDSIYNLLTEISGDMETLNKFTDGVRTFSNESTISVVGVPTATDYEEDELAIKHLPSIFPIDGVLTFFTMASSKAVRH